MVTMCKPFGSRCMSVLDYEAATWTWRMAVKDRKIGMIITIVVRVRVLDAWGRWCADTCTLAWGEGSWDGSLPLLLRSPRTCTCVSIRSLVHSPTYSGVGSSVFG